MNRTDIKRLSPKQLVNWLDEHGIRSFRSGQILKWIYIRQMDDFRMMTDLSKEIRHLLSDHFSIDRLEITRIDTSTDGSQKYLFRLKDGHYIESVLIPEKNRDTLCISSQVGCALGCKFCMTGQAGFIRNLNRGEIVAQVRDVKKQMADPSRLSNIVFMGMGEPLANYDNVTSAVKTIVDGDSGLRFASRRVTLSTAGLVPLLADIGRDTRINLAVSLNATNNTTRDRLMPINQKYPIEMLLDACRRYPLCRGRRITFEYILLRGINDSLKDASRLAELLKHIRVKINLIPFNRHESSHFKPPELSVINAFRDELINKNYTAIIRKSKGTDISAACGQLGAKVGANHK